MDTQAKLGWYLAQLKPNALALAARNLARQGFESFMPTQLTTLRRSGRFVTEPRPLFPGYLFVALDPSEAPWRKVNSTLGVARLVAFGTGQPRPVPTALIDALRVRCDGQGNLGAPETFGAGDRVEVKAGPFADFVATVAEVTPDRRVWILLDLMGRETRVALAPEDLSKT